MDPPDAVARLATERQLGHLVDVRREVSTAEALLTGWGIAALSLTAMLVLAALVDRPSVFSPIYAVLRFVVLFLFFVLVWGFVFGIRGLIVGTRIHYLYAGGLVHRRRRG